MFEYDFYEQAFATQKFEEKSIFQKNEASTINIFQYDALLEDIKELRAILDEREMSLRVS